MRRTSHLRAAVRRLVRHPLRLGLGLLLLVATALTGGFAASAATAEPAPTDACYTWDGELAEGASGDAVKELQIRIAGYPEPGEVLAIDGEFGPATTDALSRFQEAYGLSETGVADEATYEQLYKLQDDDCSPAHFDFAELNGCNSDWSGGAVSAGQAKSNALRTMWKLEALRHDLGDQPITVTSGFRSQACNDAVGGASDSRHLYGDAADLVSDNHTLCELDEAATERGFNGILGPGYPGHDDHAHVDHREGKYWDAPDCGI